ncbi:MAG: efflux transporter periplasmic adaptor subunit [Legionellales bacterium]|nr:efflux transporter periplasmic adaptor subunit [Legionellales bacterium]
MSVEINNKIKFLGLAFLIIGSFLLGTLFSKNEDAGADSVAVAEEKPLFYRNPMNPDVTSPVPAKDSMGMDYVPVYANTDSSTSKPGTVSIDPVTVQNIGVRTAIAQMETFGRNIRAVGRIGFDEERMINLHPKIEGWIEEINVDKTGENVEENQILLSIYSPMLVTTQQEYLLALENYQTLKDSSFSDVKQGASALLESTRERLSLLDVPDHQVEELEKNKKIKKNIHIHSPFTGTVVKIGAREGQYVTPKDELYMIVDLSTVWVYADIYDYEIPWVREEDKVSMTLTSVPGEKFEGKVSYIYPYAETKTRTTKVRILFDNPHGKLRPNMFADVNIQPKSMENVLTIPAEAVIRSGKRDQVFVMLSPGKYEPRQVSLGIESNGKVAVLSGVEVGEEVVTSAQFLVDSESKLREASAKMMSAMEHEGHDMAKPTAAPENSHMEHQSPPQSMETHEAHQHD